MPVTFTVDIQGIAGVEAHLDQIKEILSHSKTELEQIGNDLMQFFSEDVFESQGQVYGQAWAALNAKTVTSKLGKYPGRGILEASGKMRHAWDLVATDEYAIIKNTATNKDGAFYAKYHQDGTPKMPKRVIAKLDEERTAMIQRKFQEIVRSKLKLI
jgi:hypothetical protein